MKKLKWIMEADDAILQSSLNGIRYVIYGFSVGFTMIVEIFTKDKVISEDFKGDLYECLDFCEKHAEGVLDEN